MQTNKFHLYIILIIAIVTFSACSAFNPMTAAGQGGYIFWSENTSQSIKRVLIGDTVPEEIITDVNVTDMVIDPVHKLLYYSTLVHTIHKVNLDGTGDEIIYTGTDYIKSIDLNSGEDTLYFIEEVAAINTYFYSLKLADKTRTFINMFASAAFATLRVDTLHNKFVYINYDLYIATMPWNGTTDLQMAGVTYTPSSLALNIENECMYFAGMMGAIPYLAVKKYSAAANTYTNIITGLTNVQKICYDPVLSEIYWTNLTQIRKVGIKEVDGVFVSGEPMDVLSNLNNPTYIAVYWPTPTGQ